MSQSRGSDIPRKRSIASRLVAVLFLGVFSFQLARVFVVVEYCSHRAATGNSLEHCKDIPSGLRVPVQLGPVPPPPLSVAPEPIRAILPRQTHPPLDPPDFSFFHPPENRG